MDEVLSPREEKIRARALFEAAAAVMAVEERWTDSERGTVINVLAARDAIVSRVTRARLLEPTDKN
jgi:hypothetical protein